jgi:serine/threonine-protein kinase
MVREHDMLADKYRVERVLGQGGMGYVVAAMHLQLEQRVAVKILMPELCEHREAVERFLREARAAVRIQSEHVARVLDVGTMQDGSPFMVMEFLSGRDLARELDARGTLPIKEAVHYLLQACEAVAEAHALGIVHRDLKPANLFLTQRSDGSPLVKVLDFGVAKAIAQDAVQMPSLTESQSVIGSPQYMSPEQVRNPKGVDFRTDVWSLGIVLHELLAGATPFEGDTPFSLLAAIVSDPPRILRVKRPDASEQLEAVIAKCLAKNPAQRYASVAELADALAPHAPESALASIRRISRITRSNPAPPNAVTMPSAGRRPGDSTPAPSGAPRRDATPHSNEARDTAKNTKTNWWQSKGSASKFPRGVALAVGGAMGVAAAGLAWSQLVKPPKVPTDATALAVTSKPAATGAPSVAPAPAEISETALPAGHEIVAPETGTLDAGALPRSALPGLAAGAPVPKTKPHRTEPRAEPHPVSVQQDPLDGRH